MLTVNFCAILVSGVIYMIVGRTWYSPIMFGNRWIKLMGWTPEQIEKCKKKNMGVTYSIMFIGSLVTSFILAQFIQYTDAATWAEGAETGFWIWVGFIAPVALSGYLFEGKKWELFGINVGYNLVCLVVTGAILAIW